MTGAPTGENHAELIRVLHVDDDPQSGDTAAEFLEREADRFSVDTATNASEGLDRLATEEYDCVVSGYEMPGPNGVEFLETVREDHPKLPFVLYTGNGSEEVASEAISAGVTDYLQKEIGTDQYTDLADRVRNAVESRRLRRERQRHVDAIETAQEGISVLDENDCYVYVNQAYADLYGYEPGEMLGEHWELIYRDRDIRRINEEVLPELERTGTWHGTTTGLRADGSTFLEDHRLATTDHGELVCTVRDITDRKERERELEQRTEQLEELTTRLEEQYRYLFEEAPVMAVVTRAAAGGPVIEDCNQLFVETLGYEREAVIEEDLAEFYTGDSERQLLEGGYTRAMNGEFVREDRELVTADGEIVETLLRAVPRRDARDSDPGTLALYVDISERKELEREKSQLEEFSSIVSHDLRNPLNVAQSRVELARTECDSEHLEDVVRAHERMESLIGDLLTLARSGDQIEEVATVDLAAVTERAWENVETAEASIQSETTRSIRADRSRLQQLVENLVRNAVEHGGTDVTVTVGELADGFYVEDDGRGVPEDERDELFETGYSTSEHGTGFGLSIVRQVADAHGWSVNVTDGSDGGARFEFTGAESGS